MPNDDRVPPSDAARVVLFLDLVRAYRELAGVLPVRQDRFVVGRREPADRWNRMLRAFALRKFAATTDQVYLGKVATALTRLHPPNSPMLINRKDMDRLVEEATLGPVYGPIDGLTVRAPEVVLDLLYGLYLHGDYARWERAGGRVGMIEEHALWEWTDGLERLVYGFEQDIIRLRDDATINLS